MRRLIHYRPNTGNSQTPALKAIIIIFATLPIYLSTAIAEVKREEISEKLNRAIKFVSRNENLLVDPRINIEILTDTTIFTSNFCYTSNIPCINTIFNEQVLNKVLSDFFHDLKSFPTAIETVASRLARHEGMSMADAGWPSLRDNDISTVELPDYLDGSQIFLQTANSEIRLGSYKKIIYIRPGEQGVVARWDNGKIVTGTISASTRQNGTWTSTYALPEDFIGRIDPDLSLYCPELNFGKNEDSKTPEPLGVFNAGRATIGEEDQTRSSHMIPAARQPGIDIRILDETESCDRACISGISIAFIQAISIWRSGCGRCTGNSLAVVRAGDHVWVDMRAADRLRSISHTIESQIDLDLSNFQSNELQRYPTAPNYWGAGSYIVGYEQIDQDPQLKDTLCGIADTRYPWINYAQGILCPGNNEEAVELHPELTISKKWTDCGEEAIACAVPGGRIQIAGNYSYSLPSNSGNKVTLTGENAKPEYQINSVILHEVGHWFGLRHPKELGLNYSDVMQGNYNAEESCVSAYSLVMLNNTTDDRWKFRATSNQGLMPPQSTDIYPQPAAER